MRAEEREQLKISIIETILNSSNFDDKQTLLSFALYLSSNPDTLYNISYYTDRIDDFLTKTTYLPKKKKNIFDKIFNKIKSGVLATHPEKDKFEFIFDEIFVYTHSDFKIKMENANVFRLDQITMDKFSLRLKKDKIELFFFFDFSEKDAFIKITSKLIESIQRHYPVNQAF